MSYIDPIRITFLGPTGVGKTSVLAAMSEIMKHQTDAAKVRLTFQAETWPRLEQAIYELRERCFRPNMLGKATIGKVEYDLEVAPTVLSGWIPGLTVPVEITDYPGEWLRGTTDQIRDVKETIGRASVIMVAVDAVGLMLSRDPELGFVNISNAAEQVTNILRESIVSATVEEPKLVAFVPIRCEKWLRSGEDQKALVSRVKDVFADAISILGQPELRDKVAVVVAPVNTVGIVEFLKFGPRRSKHELDTDEKGNEIIPSGSFTPNNYEAYYHRVTESKVPQPEYADHLLRYALAFSMVLLKRRSDKQIQDDVNQAKEELLKELVSADDPFWWKWIVESLGGSVAEVPAKAAIWTAQTLVNWPTNQALSNFANGRRETLPFEVVQGSHLLSKK